jgi:preprotein translocase subunit YajC
VASNIFLFAVLAVMIVFMFTNNKKRKAQAQKLQDTVVPGAYVMLTSGIYGTVVKVDEARLTIETTPGTRLEVNRLAVRQVEANAPVAAKPAATAVAKAASTAAKPAAKAAPRATAVKKPAAKPAAKTATKK